MIRFRQIEAFRSLIMTGTSVGAAKKLHVTQPAISRLIADLEADLGFSLFSRVGGRLESDDRRPALLQVRRGELSRAGASEAGRRHDPRGSVRWPHGRVHARARDNASAARARRFHRASSRRADQGRFGEGARSAREPAEPQGRYRAEPRVSGGRGHRGGDVAQGARCLRDARHAQAREKEDRAPVRLARRAADRLAAEFTAALRGGAIADFIHRGPAALYGLHRYGPHALCDGRGRARHIDRGAVRGEGLARAWRRRAAVRDRHRVRIRAVVSEQRNPLGSRSHRSGIR